MTPSAMNAALEALPALPPHVAHVHSDGDFCQDKTFGNSGWPVDLYTADQMRDYARAAIAQAAEPEAEPVAYVARSRYGSQCHFGMKAAATAWAGEGGEVFEIPLRHLGLVSPAQAAEQPAPVAVAGWQPIETAPKDVAVLVCCSHGMYVAEWREHDIEYWHVDDNKHGPFPLRGGAPTHWMPLPAAPTPGAQESAPPPKGHP